MGEFHLEIAAYGKFTVYQRNQHGFNEISSGEDLQNVLISAANRVGGYLNIPVKLEKL